MNSQSLVVIMTKKPPYEYEEFHTTVIVRLLLFIDIIIEVLKKPFLYKDPLKYFNRTTHSVKNSTVYLLPFMRYSRLTARQTDEQTECWARTLKMSITSIVVFL